MKRLKVALLGLAGVGEEYKAVLSSDEQYELIAVADPDPELLRRNTDGHDFRGYEDYRSLIVETARAGLDILFVALEPFQSIDFVEMAAERGIAVFHKVPFARTAREAQQLVEKFARTGCPLVVSRPWQSEPAFSALEDVTVLIGRVFAVTAEVRTAEGATAWRGDLFRAGGGVLLNGAYEQLDMMVSLLGVPETVFAQCGSAVAPGAARTYDTEDGVLVSLRYAGDRIAALTAWRGAVKPFSRVTLAGVQGSVEVCPNRMTITSRDRRTSRSRIVRCAHPTAAEIRTLGEEQLAGVQCIRSRAEDHLATMAVVDAAYLSAKTGAPESPTRLFD